METSGNLRVCNGTDLTFDINFVRGRLKEPGVDGRIIFKMDLEEVGCGSIDWIELAQDRDRWLTLVNKVINF